MNLTMSVALWVSALAALASFLGVVISMTMARRQEATDSQYDEYAENIGDVPFIGGSTVTPPSHLSRIDPIIDDEPVIGHRPVGGMGSMDSDVSGGQSHDPVLSAIVSDDIPASTHDQIYARNDPSPAPPPSPDAATVVSTTDTPTIARTTTPTDAAQVAQNLPRVARYTPGARNHSEPQEEQSRDRYVAAAVTADSGVSETIDTVELPTRHDAFRPADIPQNQPISYAQEHIPEPVRAQTPATLKPPVLDVGSQESAPPVFQSPSPPETTPDFAESDKYKEQARGHIHQWDLLFGRGEWHWGLLDRAVECYVNAVGRNPGDRGAWTNLAFTYHLIGDKNRARQCLDKSATLGSSDPYGPDRDYRQVEKAIRSDTTLFGEKLRRPSMPAGFTEGLLAPNL